MKHKVIAAGEHSEQQFVDGSVNAIVHHKTKYNHILAKYHEENIYILTKEECTYDSEIEWENGKLEIVCILNKVTIYHYYNEVKNNAMTVENIREKIISFIESMKRTAVLSK